MSSPNIVGILGKVASFQEYAGSAAVSSRFPALGLLGGSGGGRSGPSVPPVTVGVRISGLKELNRDLRAAKSDTLKELRDELKSVGGIVRDDAASRFSGYDMRSAAGFKVRSRGASILVQQSIRKTSGLRPDYGTLMMTRAPPACDGRE